MSADAEALVQALLHQYQVKGCCRALLQAIAKAIPDDETMTTPTPLKQFNTGYGYSSLREARDQLVSWQIVRVVDGGKGLPAKYELRLLPGAGQVVPILPLLAVAKPRTPTAPTGQPDLFVTAAAVVDVETPVSAETRADDSAGNRQGAIRHPAGFWQGCRSYFAGFRQGGFLDPAGFWQGVRSYFAGFRQGGILNPAGFRQGVVKQPRRFPAGLPQDVDGTRARAVLVLKEEVLLPPPATADPPTRPPPDPNPARCPWFPKTHAWCAGQRNHVPTRLDEHFRRNLGRVANETDAKQRERAWAIYEAEDAKIPADAQTLWNDFDHWRPILTAYLARAAPPRASPNPHAAPSSPDLRARAADERRQRQGSGFS